jgi:hypothetical protein
MPQTRTETPKGILLLSHTPPETSGDVQRSQTVRGQAGKIEAMTPESLSQTLQEFLGGSRHAVVLEDGARIFELADSKYSVSGEYNKCLLHLWSTERNTVRRILDTEVRNSTLRLTVQRLGHTRPSKLEICRSLDHRTPTARRVARSTYQQQLRRVLERHFPGFTIS